MEDYEPETYKLFFSHQTDNRNFNRGATKNIGFLVIKELYPNDYKNITLVFNDIDTMPYIKNFLPYKTTNGIIKHFYGLDFALGGIFSITGGDFEKIGGFPNYWTWGFEDNLIQIRALNAGLKIDRSVFYPIMDKHIMQLTDGLERKVNKKEFMRFQEKNTEGFHSIKNLSYKLQDNDIIINYFLTNYIEDEQYTKIHHLLNDGAQPYKIPKTIFGTNVSSKLYL